MRYVSPLSLVAGFILDTLFLAKRVDLFLTNALLFLYLLVSAAAICLINAIHAGRVRHPLAIKTLPLLPVVAQFAFGGLFSAYLALYSKSADVAVTWIFVIAIALLMLLNERFAHFYSRFAVQIPIYFTVLFSFLIFFLPVVFHRIGPFMFLISGAASLIVISGFWQILSRLAPQIANENRKKVLTAIAIVYVGFNVLYFTGAIPPLPLSLKTAGVYHLVVKLPEGGYLLSGEKLRWYEQYLNYSPIYHRSPGEPIYVWSAVFAPSGLSTKVLHEWQQYDEQRKAWVTSNTVSFPIVGGRDGGYRGYSLKYSGEEGRWRVNVITEYGQLIGRLSFVVEDATTTPPLVETTR